jgi:hypothetical protein
MHSMSSITTLARAPVLIRLRVHGQHRQRLDGLPACRRRGKRLLARTGNKHHALP